MTTTPPQDQPPTDPASVPPEQPADQRTTQWECMSMTTGGPSGHPVFEQMVGMGDSPVCPICGSTSAVVVAQPGDAAFQPILVHEQRLGVDQFGNPQQPQPVAVDASQLPQNQPGFDADAAEDERNSQIEEARKVTPGVGTEADAAAQREAVQKAHDEAAAAAVAQGTAPAPGTLPNAVVTPVFTPPVDPAPAPAAADQTASEPPVNPAPVTGPTEPPPALTETTPPTTTP